MRIEPPLERYAGTYPTSSDANDGLAVWTKANRTIANTDIVGWYRRAYSFPRGSGSPSGIT